MGKTFIPKKKHDEGLHLVRQKLWIEKHFPCFACSVSQGTLECLAEITPCSECDTYKIRLRLKKGGVPSARIVDPIIEPESAIHMYSNGNLCLYDHREQPWKFGDNIHEKIIPWVAEWLVFDELYRLTGKWMGPEAAHGSSEKLPQGGARKVN